MSTESQDERNRREKQQQHYSYLNELQSMARELPGKFQQRLPYDLLSGLANAVLDGTVFEIVNSLREVQQLEERSLFNQRVKLANEQKTMKQEMQKRHKDAIQQCQAKPHNLALVQAKNQKEAEAFVHRYEEEIRRKDMKIILELDQKVMDQQVMLEKAGVPGFYVTNNPNEVRLQMYLLDFIIRLNNAATESSTAANTKHVNVT